MLCIFFVDLFDAEIIDNQCELYVSCVVLPKFRYQFALWVSVFVEAFFKEFVGQQSCDDLTRDRIRDCIRATRYRGCTIEHAT